MIRLLVRLYIFWIIFFLGFRILFLLHQVYNGINLNINEILYACFYGLRLDLSAASYLVVIPFLLITAYYFHRYESYRKAIVIYHYIVIPVCVALEIANMAVYHAWGTLLNRRAVSFISDPAQMLASLTTLQLLLGIIMFFAASWISIAAVRKMINVSVFTAAKIIFRVAEALILAGLIVTGIRGGWQLIPVNESSAYFSPRRVLNESATNPLWHLANNMSKSALGDKNIYAEMSDVQAEKLLKELYSGHDCTLRVIPPSGQPNIVLILLESFCADVIGPLGGDKTVTPFFSSLCDSGLLFTNIYASGRRTDQALPSVFSGFPAQPHHSISRFTEKVSRLPYMSRLIKDEGYNLSFYYGGELEFANMRGFLYSAGFEKIIGKDEFKSASMNSKWGAHDEYVLKRQLNDLATEQQPFFSAVLTLTSHEPFEIPSGKYFSGKDDPSRFKNAVRYTDECLKDYFRTARNEKWFANTLFIIMADHGHNLPLQRDYYDVASHRIPLLLYGPALIDSLKGRKIERTGAQHDVASTLLKQLNIDSDRFNFSGDLLDTCSKGFAYVDLDQSLGWITDQGSFIYESGTGYAAAEGTLKDSMELQKAIAFRQEVYRCFLELGRKNPE